MNPPQDNARRRGRRQLLLVASAFLGPLLLAMALYATNAWRPGGSVQHGVLLAAAGPLPDPLLRGRWSLVYFGAGRCTSPCPQRVTAMRQVRLALGKEMSRVQRVLFMTDGSTPAPALLAENAGLIVVTDAGVTAGIAQALGADPDGELYLVDPLGNPVLRFPATASLADVHKDLQHLLRQSTIG